MTIAVDINENQILRIHFKEKLQGYSYDDYREYMGTRNELLRYNYDEPIIPTKDQAEIISKHENTKIEVKNVVEKIEIIELSDIDVSIRKIKTELSDQDLFKINQEVKKIKDTSLPSITFKEKFEQTDN